MKYHLLLTLLIVLPYLSGCQLAQESGSELEEIRVGIQLWSVRDELSSDFSGTLQKLSTLGFDGVELAYDFGDFKDNPEGLKRLLDSLQLKALSAHVTFEQLNSDNFDRTLEFYSTLECKLLIIPWDERSWSPDGVLEVVNELAVLSKKLNGKGFRLGYHNHGQEFKPYKNRTYWDFLATNTPDEVVMQLDIGWAKHANINVLQLVESYPGRFYTMHFKTKENMPAKGYLPFIGRDSADWQTLMEQGYRIGGLRWIVLEQEDFPTGYSVIQAVEESKDGLDYFLEKLNQ